MAWSVPRVGAVTTVASGNIAPAIPSGAARYDLLVMFCSYRGSAAFTAPAGWTIVEQESSGDTDATNGIASGFLAWAIRGITAPSTTFTRTGGDVATARIHAYSGAADAPFDVSSAFTLASASATATTPGVTTAEDGSLLVGMVACGDNLTTSGFDAATDPATASGATDTTTPPTAGTWIERSDAGTGTGADTALATFDAIKATAGATGDFTATVSTAAQHVMIVAAFSPSLTKTWTTTAGDWDNTATWLGGNIPGNSDEVVMQHNLTITDARTVGLSGASGTAAITMVTADRILTIATGGELTLRGDFVYKGTFAVKTDCLTMEEGSELIFDSSAASSPSTTNYCLRPEAGGTGASIAINGTITNKCFVWSNPSGGNGFFSRDGMASIGQFFANYCRFDDIGDATRLFYENFHGGNGLATTQSITLLNCIFDGCGQWSAANNANAGVAYDIWDCTWVNTAHASRCVALPTFTVSGTKNFSGCVCDKDVFLGDGAWDVSDTLFFESYTVSGRTVSAIQNGILIRKSTQPTTTLAGSISNSYILKDGTFTNPHGLSTSNNNYVHTLSNLVLEYTGSNTNGDWISGGTPASARKHIVNNVVMLPTAAGDSSGKLISMGGSANISWGVDHNTYPSDRSASAREIAVSYGETFAGHATIYENLRSNLAWFTTANRAVLLLRFGGSVQLTTGADVSHNATWNGYTGTDGVGYESYSAGTVFSGTAPGANDVTVSADPFVDKARNLAAWDASLGGPGTTANALAELAKRNDWTGYDPNYNILDAVEWVAGGFDVTDAALQDAGHDGVTIGARPFFSTGLVATLTIAEAGGVGVDAVGLLGALSAPLAIAEATSSSLGISATSGGVLATLSVAEAVALALGANILVGGIIAQLDEAEAIASVPDITVTLAGVAAPISAADAVADALTLNAIQGAILAALEKADASASATDVTVSFGGTSTTLTLAEAAALASDTVALQSVLAQLGVADAAAEGLTLTVTMGTLTATLTLAEALALATDVTATQADILAALDSADAIADVLSVSVTLSGINAPLTVATAVGEGRDVTVSVGGVTATVSVAEAVAEARDLTAIVSGLIATIVLAEAFGEASDAQGTLSGITAALTEASAMAISADVAASIGGAFGPLATATATASAQDLAATVGGILATLAGAAEATGEGGDVIVVLAGVLATLDPAVAVASASDIVASVDELATVLASASASASALDLATVLGGIVGALAVASASASALGVTVVVAGAPSGATVGWYVPVLQGFGYRWRWETVEPKEGHRWNFLPVSDRYRWTFPVGERYA